MTVVSHRDRLDRHGHERTEVTLSCDGPGCQAVTVLDPLGRAPGEEQPFASWLMLLDVDGNEHFCTRACLYTWAAREVAREDHR